MREEENRRRLWQQRPIEEKKPIVPSKQRKVQLSAERDRAQRAWEHSCDTSSSVWIWKSLKEATTCLAASIKSGQQRQSVR